MGGRWRGREGGGQSTREQRTQHVELRHDCAHGPHVTGCVVVGGAQQDLEVASVTRHTDHANASANHLRGTVPPSADVLSEGRSGPDLLRKAKVGDFTKVLGSKRYQYTTHCTHQYTTHCRHECSRAE